jgi:hypothetical protein
MDLWVSVGRNILTEQGSLTGFINKGAKELHEYNLGLGLFLRNNILKEESELYEKFREKGITERDDMSLVIINTWHAALQQEQ